MMNPLIGVMQGRLSPSVGGKIQCFPAHTWKAEFPMAAALGLDCIEWTIDGDGFYENPLCTERGRLEINQIIRTTGVKVLSVTADSIMHEPFYKLEGAPGEEALNKFRTLVTSSISIGAKFLVFPCVDAGKIENERHTETLLEEFNRITPVLRGGGLKIVFESDYGPSELKKWIGRFDSECVGINYDMGNSASLGHDPAAEWDAYSDRIWNIHVKDRVLGGTTVALETGNANFAQIFKSVFKADYKGMFIFQVARGPDGDERRTVGKHLEWLKSRLSQEKSRV